MFLWELIVSETAETQNLIVGFSRVAVLLLGLLVGTVALILSRGRNAILSRQQVDSSFISAIEHLGHEQASVRLGAIYALEQIANNNPRTHYIQVIETLCAHIRQYSKIAKYYETRRDAPNTKHEKEIENLQTKALLYMISPELDVVPEDIFAAFVVIGRRRFSRRIVFIPIFGGKEVDYAPRGFERNRRFSLYDAHLSFIPQASENLNFSFFDFGDVDFSYGSIKNYRFNYSNFGDTNFEVASCNGADFRGAKGAPDSE